MTLAEIAKAIDVVKYETIPEDMYEYYPVPENRKGELCSLEMIERLQERFGLFKDYYEAVKKCWLALEKDELRKTYADVASLYMIDKEYKKVTKIPVPQPTPENANDAADLIQLFIHLPSVERAYELYRKRGFSEEDSLEYIGSYYGNMRHTSENILGRPTLIQIYFRWLCLYSKALIFSYGGLNYNLQSFGRAVVLKNKKTGALLPLASNGLTLHASGLVLGSFGAKDEEGAIEASFEETEDAFIGYPSEESRFATEKAFFSKEEWEILVKPGDDAVGVHIPAKTDPSPEAVKKSLEGAAEIAKNRFPEQSPKVFVCSSWLLSTDLEPILKPTSNILAFGKRYARYPIKAGGKGVFNFVFPQSFRGTYDQLPEDTSLMRSLKAIYVAGDAILEYAGVIEI
ncbi:MAG: hypothetical protein IKC69_01930 [Clostridia bacterium]|nr:hypothetical protein [Clostridia bacterium]